MIKLNNFHIVFFCYLKLYVYIYLCINFTLIMLKKKKNRNDFEICKRKTQKRLLTCYYYVTILSIE